jgi:hypothetical protein
MVLSEWFSKMKFVAKISTNRVVVPSWAMCLLIALVAGCASAPALRTQDGRTAPRATPDMPRTTAVSPTVRRLIDEANALMPLAQSDLAKRFLTAADSLPSMAPRTVYVNEMTREYFSPKEAAALPEATRVRLNKTELDEFRYYYTKYGSPLAFFRALDIATSVGMSDIAGKRILDFGYGSIGHLRLLASLGADVTGVDPDSYLDALYSDGNDQGPVQAAASRGRSLFAGRGSITLAHGYYPKDAQMVARVGQGYDIIFSKNTLKRGYIKPERKADKRQLVDLGVSDEVFLKTLAGALNPGGKIVIYNLYPTPSGPKEVYKPYADGRSPFTREQYEKAGLKVLAFEADDNAAIRRIGRALKWDKNEKGESIDNLETNLFAMYTVLERVGR